MAKEYYIIFIIGYCTIFLILQSIIFKSTTIAPQPNCVFTRKWEIRVVNRLPLYSIEPLQLHCASKNKDLGNHTLDVFEDLSWSFCDNIFGNTLFFCHLKWNSNRGPKHKAFDVFTSKWLAECGSGICYWSADEDGIRFTGSDPPNHWQKIYDWDNGTDLQEL
ncbi:hypothetical protein ABFS82_06G182900 [Erythranthe guttata]|uniref:S-protein homolog n=1 Tax=Erythranthe guttata TaxID=4155 RepID=A0A022RHK4_ERYGU|nr:hypothetical protein MIMGU_mgv1a021328mg [Erythranthe guttata]